MDISLNDFSGGLWVPGEAGSTRQQPGMAAPPNALLKADNVDFLPSGGVRGRRAIRRRNPSNQIISDGSGARMRFLYRHYARTGQNSSLRPPASVANESIPAVAWTDPTNALLEDRQYARVDLTPAQQSDVLYFSDFGFTIPLTARILGIIVRVKRLNSTNPGLSTGNIRDSEVYLVDETGTTNPYNYGDRSSNWPLFLSWAEYGGPVDIWGKHWDPSEINSANFGVRITVDNPGQGTGVALIDYLQVLVYYTDSTAVPTFISAHEDPSGPNLNYGVETYPAWVGIPGGIGAHDIPTYTPRGVTWAEKNLTFIFDGLNSPLAYNGSVLATVPSDGQNNEPPKGPFATLWRSRLYMSHPDELHTAVYASSINLLEDTQSAWDPSNHLNIADRQGGKITGLCEFNDRLVILKDTCLWFFDGDPQIGGTLAQYSDRGCVAPDSVQRTPWGVIYVASDGVYLTDGGSPSPIELSGPIRALFAGRTAVNVYRNAIGIYHPRRDQYWLKLDPDQDEAYVLHRQVLTNGRTIVAWSHVPICPLTCAAVWEGESDEGQLFFGTSDGYILEADSGSTDALDDLLESLITIDLQSVFVPIADDRNRGRAYHVKALYRGASALAWGIHYDASINPLVVTTTGSDVADPQIQHGRGTIVDLEQFGRFMSLRCISTEGPEFELHEVGADVKLRGVRQWP